MSNPYQTPAAHVSTPILESFQWKRVVVWALLIVVAAYIIGFCSGLTMARWQIYGATFEEAIANSRIVRRVAYGLVGAFLYWRFAAGVAQRRALHFMVVFALAQILDAAITFFLFGVPVGELVEPWALARSALAALVGLLLAYLDSRTSLKRAPVREVT